MSLRGALDALPDDRDSRSSARSLIGYLERHPGEPVEAARIHAVTGVPLATAESILEVLAERFVVNCVDQCQGTYVYEPSAVLSIEVRRFLRAGSGSNTRLQRGTDRFRSRYGSGG